MEPFVFLSELAGRTAKVAKQTQLSVPLAAPHPAAQAWPWWLMHSWLQLMIASRFAALFFRNEAGRQMASFLLSAIWAKLCVRFALGSAHKMAALYAVGSSTAGTGVQATAEACWAGAVEVLRDANESLCSRSSTAQCQLPSLVQMYCAPMYFWENAYKCFNRNSSLEFKSQRKYHKVAILI